MRLLTQVSCVTGACLVLTALAAGQSVAPVASGNQTLLSSLDALERHVSVAARIRHQSRLDEHTLMGSGYYWQRGTAEQRVSHWEMQTQVAGKPASFVQVFDGNHLWTDRRLPSGREVRRLDYALLQSRLRYNNLGKGNLGKGNPGKGDGAARSASSARTNADVQRMLNTAQGRGGLSQMLADLLQRFEFQPPRQVQLNGLAVYALIGQWRSAELAAIGVEVEPPADREAAPWPKQIPHHVLVLLGRDNLFPYVIEHRRADDAYLLSTVAGLRPTRDPLVRYEIFGVEFALALDPSIFQYKPGDQWSDETAEVADRLRERQELVAERLASKEPDAAPR